MCDKGFTWNPGNCECECDKSCDAGEYLDYKNCKCRKRLVDKLLEECSENIDGNEVLYSETLDVISLNTIPLNVYNETLDVISLNTIPLNVYKKACDSCTIYIVLFAVFFISRICISIVFIYFPWHLKQENVSVKFNPGTQTTIY